MNDFEKFLTLPDVSEITEEVFVSERLGKFKVRAMTAEEHGNYQKRAMGKILRGGADFDSGKFNLLVVAGQTVYPDFSNAELLKKAGCATATEFITRKLKAGEIAELSSKICELSGFESDINEDTEEAKN
jgi:hypothetical protein